MRRVWTIVGIMAGTVLFVGLLFGAAFWLLPWDAAVLAGVILSVGSTMGLIGLAFWLDDEVPR